MQNSRWIVTTLFCALAVQFGAQAQTSDIEKGRALYRSNYALCHGLTGPGGRGPDLVLGQRKPDEEIKKIIRNGVQGSTMPAFGDVEKGELTHLVDLLRDLANSSTSTQKAIGDAASAGTMSTSRSLIFSGDEDGYFMAFDATTGKNLWKLNTGNRIVTAPITYMVEGRQYVTMPSGSALVTFALPQQ